MNKVEEDKKIKLSIGILVSNQKDYIRNAMEALKPLLEVVPSELIVLDTKGEEGDGSIDIVREYTDKIYRYVWCNDFAAARNACLSYAAGEWFMYQDDDEWFDNVDELINFFNSDECEQYNSGCYYTKSYDAKGNFSMGVASRMIRVNEKTGFVGKIHECFNEFPLPCKYFESFVHHMGYAYFTPELQKRKHERNITLLKEELTNEGYTPRICVQMVQELMTCTDSLKESLVFADKVLKIFKKEGKIEENCAQWILAATVRCYVALNDYQGLLTRVKKVQSEYRRSRMAELVIAAETARYAYLEEDYKVSLEYVDDYLEQWQWLNEHGAEAAVLMQLDFPSYFTEEYFLSILYAGAVSANRIGDYQQAMKYWNLFPWKKEGFEAKKYWAEMLITRDGLKKTKKRSNELIKSDIKLTIGILVSNRKQYIRKAMEALKPLLEAVPSELIVVDTKGKDGDGSIDIVCEYTDKIYSFDWCNDFSAARNVCIEHASGEWFMYQDDDEWFDDVQELIRFFNSNECDNYMSAYYLVQNYQEDGTISRSIVGRMIRRTENTCFVGKVHESFNEVYAPCKKFECFVHHMGYAHSSLEDKKQHQMRNISLLKEELETLGSTPRICSQMVQELMYVEDTMIDGVNFAKRSVADFKKQGLLDDSSVQWIITAIIRYYALQDTYETLKEQIEYVYKEYELSQMAELVVASAMIKTAKENQDTEIVIKYADKFIRNWNWLQSNPEQALEQSQLDFPTYYTESNYYAVLRERKNAVEKMGISEKSGRQEMRRYLKKKISVWINTMYRSLRAIEKLISEERFELAYNLIVEMQKGAIHIGTLIDETGKNLDLVRDLERFCEFVYILSEGLQQEDVGDGIKEIEKLLVDIEKKLIEIPNAKLEVVFLPYKLSMWDSLESIWMAAEKDEECNAYVVPIPYYSRKENYEFDQMFYEGNSYPEYVPVVDYRSIDLERLHPDIIFFHNPYDGNNYVTSVAPEYYSAELKKVADMIVYVPYTMTAVYEDMQEATTYYRTSGMINSDIFVVQSDKQRELLEFLGFTKQKLLPLGSPKIDATVNYKQTDRGRIKEQAGDKKIFLLNTTISRLLRDRCWFETMDEILEIFENDKTIFLVWRPHPLLKATICSMRRGMEKQYDALLARVEKMSNAMIDMEAEAYPAFFASDALISDYSSLMLQYLATGKPILSVEGKEKEKEEKVVMLDFYSNYFKEDGMTYEQFVNMIRAGQDDKKEARWHALINSVNNCDGTCGEKVYVACKERMK